MMKLPTLDDFKPLNRRTDRELGDGYVKYVQECNAKVKATGNTDFKAEPEFAWERKRLKP